MKILFIQTGGTIDKDYPQTFNTHGYNFEIGEPAVREILMIVDPRFEFRIIPLLKKDSLDLTDVDRQRIYDTCLRESEGKIIITHGTDRFLETAKKLNSIKGKTIILTGAMLPAKFLGSDAMFNLGVAVGAIQNLQNGIYIAMGGAVLRWTDYKTANFRQG